MDKESVTKESVPRDELPHSLVNTLPKTEPSNLYKENPWAETRAKYLLSGLPAPFLKNYLKSLSEAGRDAALATEFSRLADRHPPELIHVNRYGEEIHQVQYHPAYQRLKELSLGKGILADKYQETPDPSWVSHRQRLGFLKASLFAQTEPSLFCPICMTDALARVLEKFQVKSAVAVQYLKRLSSQDIDEIWEGAMFLTEIQGGSDVGANAVRGWQDEQGQWRLQGRKWFCSNVDAQVSLVLARMPGNTPGTKGLGLFLLARDFPALNHKNWRVMRLKDKLGVRSMASGEVDLNGAAAELLGGEGVGFKMMTEMVNMSRLYNAVASLGVSQRAVREALAWGHERKAFGQKLIELPAWRNAMADLVAEHLAQDVLVFEAIRLLDRVDHHRDDQAKATVRALTPITKALSGKWAAFVSAEAMELVGGNAYIEDHILPRLYRDVQVLPIWEGTTQIQSLDLLRVIKKESPDAIFKLAFDALQVAEKDSSLKPYVRTLEGQLQRTKSFLKSFSERPESEVEHSCRAILETLGRGLQLALVARDAAEMQSEVLLQALARLLDRPFAVGPIGMNFAPNSNASEEVLLTALYQPVGPGAS